MNTRQEVAKAIKERTGADVGEVLSDDCLAQYESLDEEDRRVRLERAIERVQLWEDLRSLPEEARRAAREKLETVQKLLQSPDLAGVTSHFMDEMAMLEAIAHPEEYTKGCPLPSVLVGSPGDG
jgi:hypothetical protein